LAETLSIRVFFIFGHEDPLKGEFYIGSADWMYRNLHARVEAVVPILDDHLKEKLWEIIQISLKDKRQTWDMQSDGKYIQRKSDEPGVHQILMSLTKQKIQQLEELNQKISAK
jgi:polyphosphate kinase